MSKLKINHKNLESFSRYLHVIKGQLPVIYESFSKKSNSLTDPTQVDFVAVEKPAGMSIVGPDGTPNAAPLEPGESIRTTVRKLLHDYYVVSSSQWGRKVRPTHRLDVHTSGILCIALEKKAARKCQKCFSQKDKIQKHYIALIEGHLDITKFPIFDSESMEKNNSETNQIYYKPNENKLHISTQLEIIQKTGASYDSRTKLKKDLLDQQMPYPLVKVIDKTGKMGITDVQIISHGYIHNQRPATKVILSPETGRTHQLRVHMQYIGNPIIGDFIYNDEYKNTIWNPSDFQKAKRNQDGSLAAIDRLCLHAYELYIGFENTPLHLQTDDPFVPYYEPFSKH
eukprot:gb/GECH01011401.1/.p1 GENE.gb/GECH01011401.1/~~gb/GECH01011401.1/.p1  ORF type:complete len:341 (+),score=64.31 gb/GECH01011401.1/:1-1023(+)